MMSRRFLKHKDRPDSIPILIPIPTAISIPIKVGAQSLKPYGVIWLEPVGGFKGPRINVHSFQLLLLFRRTDKGISLENQIPAICSKVIL